jgi:hypothetical protein
MSHPLILSSLVFSTNMIMAQFKDEPTYSFLFGLLTVSSLFFYVTPSLYTNVADKVAVLLFVVCYGAYQLYLKGDHSICYVAMIVFSFLACVGLFFYGYFTQQYCYDPELGVWYHVLLHFISSMGHHAILFL